MKLFKNGTYLQKHVSILTGSYSIKSEYPHFNESSDHSHMYARTITLYTTPFPSESILALDSHLDFDDEDRRYYWPW